MDGLPGMQRGLTAAKKYSVQPIKKMVGLNAPGPGSYKTSNGGFTLEQVLLVVLLAFLAGVFAASFRPELLHELRTVLTRQSSLTADSVFRSLR